jgi:3-oxoacyl-[acyl-carrier-protein] synthase-3
MAGTGHALPARILSNADLERLMDTSNEWIVQRTGIRTRHIADRNLGESTLSLAATALRRALADAAMDPLDLDLVILATMTGEMTCPPTACRLVHELGAVRSGAFDLNAACSGFVFGLNVAHELIRGGAYRNIALVGADTLSMHMDYSTAGRGTAILFGDGAGAVILRVTDDPSKGVLAQSIHTDGGGWKDIYIPKHSTDFPPGTAPDPAKFGRVQMNGASVFKFAVGTFPDLIQETLDKAGLKPTDVDMFICHQSNQRILTAARERFGLPEDKLYVNIDRVGNTVAASVPICLDELRKAGRVRDGMKIMLLAFGGGLTWGSSLWQL